MVFRTHGLPGGGIVDHGSTRPGRWLRARRLKLAFWIAAVAIAFYVWVGRDLRFDAARQSSWVAAASQALVVLVPILLAIIGGLAIFAVVVLAVVAVVVLFADRR